MIADSRGVVCKSVVGRCQLTGTLLVNELDVQTVLYGKVRLAAVNHITVFYEFMNGCKYLKIHL